jgi:FAD/FMN-containing dehydrogenase
MTKELLEDLKSRIKGEIFDDEQTLKTFSRDTSLFEIKPTAVVVPKDVDDIKTIVQFVNDNKREYPELSLTPRSGGTDMSGGAIGTGLIIDFTQHFDFFDIDAGNSKAVVQPGVFYKNFAIEAEKLGLEMPTFPASKDIAAFGGMVGNNCGGEKTLQYGQIRKYVKRIKVVLSNGEEYEFKKITIEELQNKMKEDSFLGGIYRRVFDLLDSNYYKVQQARPETSKNSSGYAIWDVYNRDEGTFDMTQLFTGAQGTLGIITEIELDLVKIKKHKKLVTIFLKKWDHLPDLVNQILPVDPISLETFDRTTMFLGMKFMPKIAKKVGIGTIDFMLSFLPEFKMGIRLMKMPQLIVLAQFEEDDKASLEAKVQRLGQILKKNRYVFRTVNSQEEAQKFFVIRRESFNLLRKGVGKKVTVPFVDDFCILPQKLPQFLPDFLKILKEFEIKANITGHAGSGNLHVIPLMDLNNEEERRKIRPCANKIYDLIIKNGGTITAEHNDGLIRTPFLKDMFGSLIYSFFVTIKDTFDPQTIFNPGKKVNADKNFAFDHMKRN